MPEPTEVSFKNIAADFWRLWGFPNCVGTIDGKHIRVKCPKHSGTIFYNYKNFFSIVLQAVADAKYKFIAIEVGGCGKQSDGGTFSSSQFYSLLRSQELALPHAVPLPGTSISMPHVFLADEAYPLLENLLKPYPRRDCSLEKEYFNRRLSRARRCVECAFGILNAKWRILWKPIETKPSFAESIIKTICVLHNTIMDLEGAEIHLEQASQFINRRPEARRNNNASKQNSRFIRETFCNFVCNNRQ